MPTTFRPAPPGSDLDTAQTAMRHWIAGAAGGDWSALLAMLDPQVVFHVPVSGFEGVRHGADAARAFFDHLAAVLRAAARFGFEVSVRGAMHARAFRQALCLVFQVGDGRVLAFHEYLAWPGGLDLDAAG